MTINVPNRIIILGGIAAYWVGRVATQITYYPMYQIAKRAIFTRGGYDMNLLLCSLQLYMQVWLSKIYRGILQTFCLK